MDLLLFGGAGHFQGGILHLLARIQDEVRAADEAAGYTGSAVDELIDERCAEAAREDASYNATVEGSPA